MNKNIILSIIALHFLSLTVLGQDCDNTPDWVRDKIRYLGSWTESGKPLYLHVPGDDISQELMSFLNTTLPPGVDQVATNPELFNGENQLNTVIQDTSEVWITFVDEGAGWENTLGFYTYPLGEAPTSPEDIDSLVILFPNVSKPNSVKAGDKILLGTFYPNTVIGYFLIAQGWVDGSVCVPEYIIFTDKELNLFTTPPDRQHTILLYYENEEKFFLCIEDVARPGGDKDFNDVVFYITSSENGIDTSNVVKVPEAHLRGDTTLCSENFEAELRIDLIGTAPWTVSYTIGEDTITIDGITSSPHFFTVSAPGRYDLIRVRDKNTIGIASGSAEVSLDNLTAEFDAFSGTCEGDTQGIAVVNLTGTAPWTLTYTIDNEPFESSLIDSNSFKIEALLGQLIRITSVSDAYCSSNLDVSYTMSPRPPVAAQLTGPEVICEGGTAILEISFTGMAPWTVVYSDGTTETEIITNQSPILIEASSPGSYSLVSFSDAYCPGSIDGLATITTAPLPSAELSAIEGVPPVVCEEGDVVTLRLDLSGTSPWSVLISNGTTEFTVNANESPYEFAVSSPGTYRIVSVTDAFCTGTGTGEVTVGDGTEDLLAEILTDDILCFGETLEISVTVDDGTSYELTTDGTGFLAQTGETSFTYTPSAGEAGVITFFLEVSNECGSKTVSAEVMLVEELDTSFTYDPEKPLSGQSVQFTPNNTTYDSYFWDFGDGNTSTEVNPVHIYEIGGEYTVVLKVVLEICENEGEEGIAVETINQLYVPSAFNPSAINPENQVVKVYGTNVSEEEFAFRIVNRWGKTMYETRSFIEANTVGWSGDNANTGELQDLNVFTWILRGKFNDGETFEKTGTVTKIK